jgi:PilZ domain-containing protein
MSSTSVAAIPGKITARTASVHIDPACNAFLGDCFRQFGISIVPLEGDPVAVFHRQKFEACVLRLYDPDADRILRSARNSPSNRRMVIYGIARNTQEALRYSGYGINAVLDEPLDRQSVLKIVRATHLLVIHELRRYVRIPVVSPAEIETNAQTCAKVTTVEVSSGGMSIRSVTPLPRTEPVRLWLNLPGLEKIGVRAFITWYRDSDKVYGLRFDSSDDRRLKVRAWIDQYLEIV